MSTGYVPGTDPELDLAMKQQADEQAAARAGMTHTEAPPVEPIPAASPFAGMSEIANAIPAATTPPVAATAPLAPPLTQPVPVLPHQETEGSTTTSTRSVVKMTPELKEETAATKTAAATASKDRAAAIAAQEKSDLAGQTLATAAAKIAAEKTKAAEQSQIDQEAVQARFDAADTAAKKQVEQTTAALKNFKFRDFWANKSTVRRVGSALAVAMGAFGASMNHTQNYALEILNKEMDDDHRNQVDQLKQLSDDDIRARTGIADAAQGRQQALAGLTIKDAAKNRIIASKLEEAASVSNDKNYQSTVEARVAKLRADADEKDAAAHNMLRDQALAMAPKTSTSTTTTKKTVEGAGLGRRGGKNEDESIVRDENGVPIGRVPSGRGGAVAFAARDADLSRGVDQLKALEQDVVKHGARALTPDEAQRRNAIYQGALIGVGAISPLGKSDESLKVERGNLGPSGALTLEHPGEAVMGANLTAIRHKIEEVEKIRQRYRAQTLIPLSAAEQQAIGSAQPAPAAAPTGGRRFRTREGQVGTLMADGSFHPDS